MSRPARTCLVVLAIALGVAMITAMRVATDSVVRGFDRTVAQAAGRTDLQVAFGTAESGFPEEILYELRELPVVGRAAAIVRGSLAFTDGSREVLELYGVDVLSPESLELYDVQVVERVDDAEIINNPFAVFVSSTTARARGLRLRDRVDLASARGVNAYTISGILELSGLTAAYGDRVAVMFLPAAQMIAGRRLADETTHVDQIDIELASGVGLPAARRAIEAILPSGLVVYQPQQRIELQRRTVSGLRATLVGISTFALLAAIFVVYSTISALVTYRTPGMGSLLALGARGGALVQLVVAEAALLGAVGGSIGVVLGSIMAGQVVSDVAAGMELNYALPAARDAGVHLPVPVLVLHALIGSAAAAVAAYFPARRLRRIDPLQLQSADPEALVRPPMRALFAAGALIAVVGAGATRLGVLTQSAAWSSFGGIAVVLGSVILLLPIAHAAWARARRPLEQRFGVVGWLAGANLTRGLERSTVTVSAIALCIACAVTAATLPGSFRRSVNEWYGFYGDAVVSSRFSRGGWLPAPVDGAFAEAIRAMSSAANVETLRVAQGQSYGGDRVAVAAMSDGIIRSALSTAPAVRARAAELISKGEAVAVSTNFAVRYGVRLGDEVSFDTPSGSLSLPVLAQVSDYTSDRGSIIVGRDLYRKQWQDELVNYIGVDLADSASLALLHNEMADAFGQPSPLSLVQTRDLRRHVDGVIGAAFADVDGIQLLVLVITLAGIVDLLISNTLDRRQEHALLRTVGMRDGRLVRSAVLEAAVLGVTAGVLGVVAGAIFAALWIAYIYPVLVGYVLTLHFAWSRAILSVVLAAAAAGLAGGLSSRFGVRLPITAGIRGG